MQNYTLLAVAGVVAAALLVEAFINVNSICHARIKPLADRIESSWWHMTINNGTIRWASQGVANLSPAIKASKVEFEDLKRRELFSFWQGGERTRIERATRRNKHNISASSRSPISCHSLHTSC